MTQLLLFTDPSAFGIQLSNGFEIYNCSYEMGDCFSLLSPYGWRCTNSQDSKGAVSWHRMVCEILRRSWFWVLLFLWAGQPTYLPPHESWVAAGFSFLVRDNVGEKGLAHKLAIWWRKLKFLTPLPLTASQVSKKPMQARQAQRWMCAFKLSPPGPDPPPSWLLMLYPGGCGLEEKESWPPTCAVRVSSLQWTLLFDELFLTPPLHFHLPHSFLSVASLTRFPGVFSRSLH